MKMFFLMFFMIPLCFYNFFIIQVFYYLMFFMFLLGYGFNGFSGLSYNFGFDSYSYYFILLSIWVSALMLMASMKVYYSNNYWFLFSLNILILLFSLLIIFSSLNLFIFYLFFEISLIPLMMLILGWGYQPERLMAGMYMMFYTLIFSLPMMIGIFFIYDSFKTLNFFEFDYIDEILIFLLINFVFFIKIPMYMIHLWLPKAHVEAPVSGSMILAGLMLKLGGYGMMRLMKIFMMNSLTLNIYFLLFSLLGGLIISLVCLFQVDMKSLVAYSSVAHMSLVVGGILSMSLVGFMGAFIMMIAHGLCSSGLFCMTNIYYERFMSRSFYLVKGLINIFPSFSFLMFMFSIINMSAPPSINLLGEINLLISLISYSSILLFILMFISFFSAYYSVYLYSYSNHGSLSSVFYSFFGGFVREYLLLILHLIPLNLFILFSDLFINF
uniref:NADH-ubiquinone oxidoreductase chain 4 n=1 Tax=Rhadinosa nigrocyanea TaxID=2093842 RepID=A0A343UQA7_9CUCU|nr:NADH dehydrogenase subunit 4 [Rhadinosa nigrocyanea]AVF96882.1 NADH dehydrogenase subunit 4 [Rhadinosa nigrocyanea]